MTRLGRLVQESIAASGGPILENQVFGTTDPESISERIAEFCHEQLGEYPTDGVFYSTSVGCVAGVLSASGRGVAIKTYQARWTASFLTAVLRIQRHLASRGFPCPTPMAGPAPLGVGMATAEELIPDPGPTPVGMQEMRLSARGLARVVATCRGEDPTGLVPHPLDAASGSLYPDPHSPAFDFTSTAAGAEWIDELASSARMARNDLVGDRVVAHTDWSARNVRLSPKGLVVAYDWDSLALVAETTAVGQAAATWSSFAADDPPLAPSAQEVARYVGSYESERGVPFTSAERDAAGAAALWVLAYTARCEHALASNMGGPRRAQGRLRAEGDTLLRLSSLLPVNQ